jgi:hypothetical protein
MHVSRIRGIRVRQETVALPSGRICAERTNWFQNSAAEIVTATGWTKELLVMEIWREIRDGRWAIGFTVVNLKLAHGTLQNPQVVNTIGGLASARESHWPFGWPNVEQHA